MCTCRLCHNCHMSTQKLGHLLFTLLKDRTICSTPSPTSRALTIFHLSTSSVVFYENLQDYRYSYEDVEHGSVHKRCVPSLCGQKVGFCTIATSHHSNGSMSPPKPFLSLRKFLLRHRTSTPDTLGSVSQTDKPTVPTKARFTQTTDTLHSNRSLYLYLRHTSLEKLALLYLYALHSSPRHHGRQRS